MKYTYITTPLFLLLLLAAPSSASAEVQLEFRPHCEDFASMKENPFGTVPAVGFMVEINSDTCTKFSSKDPKTLQVLGLKATDELLIDVVIRNSENKELKAVNTSISFDPESAQLSDVEIDEDFFGELTPGGDIVDNTEGTLQLIANTSSEQENTDSLVRIATFTLTVTADATSSTLRFATIDSGNTGVYSTLDSTAENLLKQNAANLLIGIEAEDEELIVLDEEIEFGPDEDFSEVIEEDTEGVKESAEEPEQTTVEEPEQVATKKSIGEACSTSDDCLSENCNNNTCAAAGISVPNGGSCIVDFQCASFFCNEGTCSESTGAQNSSVTTTSVDTASTTSSTSAVQSNVAFSLLQVQNVQLTTEDTNVYIQWDALQSSQVQGYTVYYGTVRSQYIQRKTVPVSETSVAIRNLPKGVQYFFALKAVNSAGDETAFSPEVSVVIGNATTSTSPFAANLVKGNTAITSGEAGDLTDTGASSLIVFALLAVSSLGVLWIFGRKRTAAESV